MRQTMAAECKGSKNGRKLDILGETIQAMWCNKTLRRVPLTIVAVEKQQCILYVMSRYTSLSITQKY
jgi:hypothetical protein